MHWIWTGALGAFAAALVALLVMRMQEPEPLDGATSADVIVPDVPAEGYPAPPANGVWDTLPLVEDAYVRVMTEAACVSLDHRGTPEDLRWELDRIYYHYQTNVWEVAAFGEDLGYDDIRAIAVAERIAEATANCP